MVMVEDQLQPENDTAWWVTYKIPLVVITGGIFLLLLGLRIGLFPQSDAPKVEFVENTQSATKSAQIKVEVAGAITRPGVYTLTSGSRVEELLQLAGGLADIADFEWVAKNVNLAAKLTDSSKIYIPKLGETAVVQGATAFDTSDQTLSKPIININSASKAELDTLPGVGEVTAQKIISGRPYQTVEELLSKKAVNQSTFEKIKESITVY
ncbi:MAG: Competence protein ComEA helix-hairpin-helix repeat protein [Candidatus Gottesmanbacteria bacterium GW2011_GWB1_43_11]|uniref:Competence protein ComEA helix-hairpin-helix repeat protein n=1 Tax=Candidatus Gottesmanbacteria bacterium GW2011_GWB1_43_11 TaxID=1618446 RepID=A0A0G1CHC6_9BACT|nr:MAG: Competence protein ComEA helix-hairpin-helix repeat protein [Candidatus Gottesmanbacteria bacterium GW2011_GWA1_42_26]KKS81133.1 MAG: Competence protein ComEA helix-hairpin-helix repeat protein [Candidatus Gottesmanbacteria bacterium GW2011_GWC1_43_10]KKS84879.1 MAG: Competence protein ComEA helix-hairpin-helix repeat protein [Candidatus Gottesmanbacteria bacterium GW2011_GWB1_43_11]OGG25382.1 MAG: hypothetical protein A3A59_01760 [Candidatus Gottesmanbacteria bacterium RIFCSPLOWO2_01_FU